ncbi:MAG: PAS domain-containing sensor histidine kinase [Rhodospirillales bacterium]|nr:PAS domain-containing sensor histidine kinase [Rhodospirillales bacterium]
MGQEEPAETMPFGATAEWFRNSLERCPLGVAIIRERPFTRLFANQACARLFGAASPHEFISQDIDNSFVDKADVERTRAALQRGEDIVDMECRRYRKDGSITWMVSNSSKTEFDGQQAHIFWMHDISERKLAELQTHNQLQELQKRKKQLEEQAEALSKSTMSLSIAHRELEKLNREKDSFLSIVAHDLRSPFTGLLGATELLARRSDKLSPDDVADYAVSLHETTKNVHDFLEGLLDWAQLHKGLVPFDPTPYPVAETIGLCISELSALSSNKDISVESFCHARRQVVADKSMITKVCRNLLSNAIKFTASGGRIEIHLADDGPDVTVAIYDTGVGLSDTAVDNLFQLDKKTSTPGTEGEAGAGMGLILCKEMIARHGGRITVFSQPGHGSTFQFWLPAA